MEGEKHTPRRSEGTSAAALPSPAEHHIRAQHVLNPALHLRPLVLQAIVPVLVQQRQPRRGGHAGQLAVSISCRWGSGGRGMRGGVEKGQRLLIQAVSPSSLLSQNACATPAGDAPPCRLTVKHGLAPPAAAQVEQDLRSRQRCWGVGRRASSQAKPPADLGRLAGRLPLQLPKYINSACTSAPCSTCRGLLQARCSRLCGGQSAGRACTDRCCRGDATRGSLRQRDAQPRRLPQSTPKGVFFLLSAAGQGLGSTGAGAT